MGNSQGFAGGRLTLLVERVIEHLFAEKNHSLFWLIDIDTYNLWPVVPADLYLST